MRRPRRPGLAQRGSRPRCDGVLQTPGWACSVGRSPYTTRRRGLVVTGQIPTKFRQRAALAHRPDRRLRRPGVRVLPGHPVRGNTAQAPAQDGSRAVRRLSCGSGTASAICCPAGSSVSSPLSRHWTTPSAPSWPIRGWCGRHVTSGRQLTARTTPTAPPSARPLVPQPKPIMGPPALIEKLV